MIATIVPKEGIQLNDYVSQSDIQHIIPKYDISEPLFDGKELELSSSVSLFDFATTDAYNRKPLTFAEFQEIAFVVVKEDTELYLEIQEETPDLENDLLRQVNNPPTLNDEIDDDIAFDNIAFDNIENITIQNEFIARQQENENNRRNRLIELGYNPTEIIQFDADELQIFMDDVARNTQMFEMHVRHRT